MRFLGQRGRAASPQADVCLLLEGTYPFVRGGVSSWTHQIVTGLPDLRFALVFVGGRRQDYGEARYELPDNVVSLQTYYLEDALRSGKARASNPSPAEMTAVEELHTQLARWARSGDGPHARPRTCPAAAERQLDRLMQTMGRPGGLQLEHFLHSDAAWRFLHEVAEERYPEAPFVDLFWTLRQAHAPLFQLARIADEAPEARVYHTISTGYSGFLGALLERRRGRPLILTEHGIYTKERRIDLNQADWMERPELAAAPGLADPSADLRSLWVRYFESLGRITYRSASPIISLYAGNRARQHADGADPTRTRVIVNGIDPERFAPALAARPAQPPRVIGFIGRVVPIKDVKTFVRALHHVVATLPDTEGWVIGGADEDPAYAADCESLVESLGLGGRIRFLGHQNVTELLPQLGLLMLTSISEAQPLAILEAFAAGVPCVATDVGACREQIEGGHEEDRALGLAGRIAPFADGRALGQAAIELLSSPEAWHGCQRVGLTRVRAHYTQRAMLDAYRETYREAGVA